MRNRTFKICVVTGSRAEYGLLHWVMRAIRSHPRLRLHLVATGMHLAPEFGQTAEVMRKDGFRIDREVDMLLAGDSPVATAKSIGVGVLGFADAFAGLRPDLVVLLGDRFELLAAAQSAHILRIPLAHIAGGDLTEGAFDDAIRHSLTKMSHLHFVTNADAARRVRQMGEDPAMIFNYGSPGLDYVRRVKLLSRTELQRQLNFTFRQRNLVVTFHPVTLGARSSRQDFAELLAALDALGSDVGLIFTRPNADTEGRRLIIQLDAFASRRPNACVHTSLGQLRYLSLLRQVDVMVGNSSSGLYEAPSFRIPTVNIGERQASRLRADSVLDCPPKSAAILQTIRRAFRHDCSHTVNPYGDGHASLRIAATIARILPKLKGTRKKFCDLPVTALR